MRAFRALGVAFAGAASCCSRSSDPLHEDGAFVRAGCWGGLASGIAAWLASRCGPAGTCPGSRHGAPPAVFGASRRFKTNRQMGTVTMLQEVMQTNGVAGIIAEIRAEVGACRLCKGMRPFKKTGPESFGTTTTGYMLVGDAPTYGAPFDDSAGAVLRQSLRDVGDEEYAELEDLFFLAHTTRCVAPHPDNTRNKKKTRPPTRVECRTCRPYLQFEIRAMHPKLILAIGGRAATAVLGEPVKIVEVHGHRHRIRDAEVLTLLAPSPHNRVALKKLDMTIEGYGRWLTGLFGALIDERRR